MQTDVEKFIEWAKTRNRFRTLGRPVLGAEIEKAERALGTHFPAEYRDLVQSVGFVEWDSNVIVGVADDPEMDTALLTRQLSDLFESVKRPGASRIPSEGNVIMEYGGGGYYFLYGTESNRSGEVILFAVDEGEEVESWSTFSAFLNSLMKAG